MNIRVDDPAQLKSYGAEIMSVASDYKAQIEKIYQILDDLSNTWQGTKSQNFKNKMDSCREQFTKFGDNLNNFGDLIQATGDAYVKAEQE